MEFFTILVFVLNEKITNQIVTESEWACSNLMSKHLNYEGDLYCVDTGVVSSSLRPLARNEDRQ